MGKKPRGSEKVNRLATVINENGMVGLHLQNLFAAQIREPFLITRTEAIDRLELKQKLLGVDTTDERAAEEEKLKDVNQAILELQDKQIRYILTEICKKAGRNEEEVERFLLLQGGRPTAKDFVDEIEELRKVYNSEGQQLNIYNTAMTGGRDEKPLLVSQEDINQIIRDSALVENIGAAKEEHLDLLDKHLDSTSRMKKHQAILTKTVLQKTGYTEAELDEAFQHSFEGLYTSTVDYDELKDARNKLLTDRMNSLPEDQRNEEHFVEESEKLDLAMRAYVFPKQNPEKLDEIKAFCNMTKEEYEAFAIGTTHPTAVAQEVESQFSAIISTISGTGFSNAHLLRNAAGYIKHLEDVHKSRPFLTRLVDYFKRNGEDSTIKRMKARLRDGTGFSKEEVKEALRTADRAYIDGDIGRRFQMLNDVGKAPVWEPIEEVADDLMDENEKLWNTLAESANAEKSAEQQNTVEVQKDLNRKNELIQEEEPQIKE